MTSLSRSLQYHPLIKILHWLVALLVFVVWPLGFLQFMVTDEYYGAINYWHTNLGFLVFWLMLARLCVRFLTRTPEPLDGSPRWTVVLATLNHWLLYIALIAQTGLGFWVTNAQGFPLDWFGVIPVWDPIGKSEAAGFLLNIHELLAWLILALVLLHVCGALFHRLVLRDESLQRVA